MLAPASLPRSLAVLRRFAKPPAALERCDLCGADVAAEHEHLLEPTHFELKCTCGRCAVLFAAGAGQALRRVPQVIEALPGLEIGEATWDGLALPIGLAYFVQRSSANRVMAYYPGPAGATESALPMAGWETLATGSPRLGKLAADVEALLVNRLGGANQSYVVSIDECFTLVGQIRSSWRGLTGGAEMSEAVHAFFSSLARRAHA